MSNTSPEKVDFECSLCDEDYPFTVEHIKIHARRYFAAIALEKERRNKQNGKTRKQGISKKVETI